ncbi:hypothetical protein [Acidithiobacillus albertensis]|uniref:hypothetical protein n=1 Tax=Acidithiobacillus albertensis TaxID=119978 RepID=UPI001C07E7A3|nr:hypothetical protein [Acidithiobacillus albertensis]MBU2741476.1 hypothetical protein [Acidithiobacillus albertensis]
MDKALRDGIDDILNQRQKIKTLQEGIKESVAALAERYDLKSTDLNKVIGLVEKERGKGGVLAAERGILDTAEDAVL